MAEVVRRILRDAYIGPRPMGTVIREIMGRSGVDLEIPPRGADHLPVGCIRHRRPVILFDADDFLDIDLQLIKPR